MMEFAVPFLCAVGGNKGNLAKGHVFVFVFILAFVLHQTGPILPGSPKLIADAEKLLD